MCNIDKSFQNPGSFCIVIQKDQRAFTLMAYISPVICRNRLSLILDEESLQGGYMGCLRTQRQFEAKNGVVTQFCGSVLLCLSPSILPFSILKWEREWTCFEYCGLPSQHELFGSFDLSSSFRWTNCILSKDKTEGKLVCKGHCAKQCWQKNLDGLHRLQVFFFGSIILTQIFQKREFVQSKNADLLSNLTY